MTRMPPTESELEQFYEQYPTIYAQCRTWRHGPEKPYSVSRPKGPRGFIEVTRICACGRLVTRVYTSRYEPLPGETRVAYATNPRYLALPGAGGVDKSRIAKRAIDEEEKAIARDQAPAKSAQTKPVPTKATQARKPQAAKISAKKKPSPKARFIAPVTNKGNDEKT